MFSCKPVWLKLICIVQHLQAKHFSLIHGNFAIRIVNKSHPAFAGVELTKNLENAPVFAGQAEMEAI